MVGLGVLVSTLMIGAVVFSAFGSCFSATGGNFNQGTLNNGIKLFFGSIGGAFIALLLFGALKLLISSRNRSAKR